MARVITQETFDDTVKENITDFSMTPHEAKDETIKQFEAQGVNLANIIKDLSINEVTGEPILIEVIEQLKKHVAAEKHLQLDELKNNLQILDVECKKSVPHRVLAAKNGANEILLSIMNNEISSMQSSATIISNDANPNEILLMSLQTANTLTNKFPDIFNTDALDVIQKILENVKDEQILCLTLQWLGKACIMHEMNRQAIMNTEILKYLKPFVSAKNGKILRDVCTVFRYLILDDDIRFEFGKAHEHARTIGSEFLKDLTKMLAEYDDLNVLCDLILTIASLTVRHEFCVAVEEAGGLKLVLQLISKNPDAVRLNREALKLLRALAGHDTIKSHIVQQGAAPIIHDLLVNNKTNDILVAGALVCISTLTLRSKENGLAFFKANLPEVIVDILRLYPKNQTIVKYASWAIRNMVSRLREHCVSFLSLGVEDVLNEAMKEHPGIEQDIKAALRDLGCKVKLREEWTGKSEKKISN